MRSAIVGCGGVAQVHAKAIELMGPGSLIAVADIDPERAKKMAMQYHAKAYDSLASMLCAEQIDVLHICTPHHLHVPMAIAALKVGINVFMEKPPVIDKKQWEALQKTVREKRTSARLGICFQNRYNDSVQYVKERLEKGEYGRILGIRGLVTWSRNEDYYASGEWRAKMATSGGGALMCQAIHTLDLMQYFMKERYTSVNALLGNLHLPAEIDVEDVVAAHINYPGAVGSFFVTTGYAKDVPPILELECEKARVRIEEDLVTVFAGENTDVRTFSGQKRLGKSYWGMGHASIIKDFYDCLQSGKKFPVELADVASTVELVLEIYGRN